MEAENTPVPTKLQIADAERRLRIAHLELSNLKSLGQRLKATQEMSRAKLKQRLTTLIERIERRKIEFIQRRLAPR